MSVDDTNAAVVPGAHATPDKPPDSKCCTSSCIMPKAIVIFATTYLVLLVALFITYIMWSNFRLDVPKMLGPLPTGVVWFGATGAVISSFRGIYTYNRKWDLSYNIWHYTRPLIGAVTGSIGALFYWVLLSLGSKGTVTVDTTTFFVVAFVLGFADKAFMEMLHGVTDVIIKPGTPKTPAAN